MIRYVLSRTVRHGSFALLTALVAGAPSCAAAPDEAPSEPNYEGLSPPGGNGFDRVTPGQGSGANDAPTPAASSGGDGTGAGGNRPNAVLAEGTCTAIPSVPSTNVPGVVVSHSPKSTRMFVGSPSIVILPNGNYVAAHDLFGPAAPVSPTLIFGSEDRGATWRTLATLPAQTWSNLFWSNGALYLLGMSGVYGRVQIRKSDDGGRSWTSPTSDTTGILSETGFHTAPTPMVATATTLYRAVEDIAQGGGWPAQFRAHVMSATLGNDLLRRDSWAFSNPIARNAAWLDRSFNGWLEGNAVLTPSGTIADILRVDGQEVMAAPHVDPASGQMVFDPASDFVDFPGGAKKFTIRLDATSKRYYALTNPVAGALQTMNPGEVRNTLALVSSPDLRHWRVDRIVLQHPDARLHAFQYVDWQFDGADLVAVARTAYDDGAGGADSYHNANYLTFHRIPNFRKACVVDDGRVGAWAFDDDGVAPAVDGARAHWAATEGGVTRGIPGRVGKAFRFDGASGNVRVHASTTIVPARDDFSVFAYIATKQTSQGHIFSNNTAQAGRANLGILDGKLFWFHNGGVYASSNRVVADGKWHHVGITRKGSVFTAYVDGQAIPLGMSNAPIATDTEWRIGSSAMPSFFFAGAIDDVRAYQKALDGDEVRALVR